ncbi:hypothetical protein YDYSY3_30940 [Paenibacillus chitinolyticus]|uniref:hypothetical protein n=1 Tax=Paenibacillus chitinolyticus TaxID=79263 RepID=UPI0026E4E423|nr:hypothetical protein [Paenibacillus chitinolyticus]GKS12094.1 hypothetical protein YDYSY3_30940 [Paenibacillus chitinolyticus]
MEKSLEGIERQISNIVNAIASGISNTPLIDKLEELEKQKLLEVRSQNEKAVITEETLRQLLSQVGAHIATDELPEIKKFIGSYMEKVIVYEKHVEVIFKLPVLDLTYGSEGSIAIPCSSVSLRPRGLNPCPKTTPHKLLRV